MNNSIARTKDLATALEAERRLMNQALGRLGQVNQQSKPGVRRVGRLIFGLDLTESREHSLKEARLATVAMFEAVKAIGSLAVQLIYFRGVGPCQKSEWHSDPTPLVAQIKRLACESGSTQIGSLLKLAMQENAISGVVYVGDHCEEDEAFMYQIAREMKKHSVPLFIFHECADRDEWSLEAKPIFKRMAEISGGYYVEFKPESGEVLKELLTMIGAHSTAGKEAVQKLALPQTTAAKSLKRLLLTSG